MSYTNYFVTTVSQTNNYKHNIKDINKNHKNFKNNLRSAVYKSNFGSIPAKYENFLFNLYFLLQNILFFKQKHHYGVLWKSKDFPLLN